VIDSAVLSATIFSPFPHLVFGISTRNGGISPGQYGLNMSFSVGDDPSNVTENQRRFLGHLGIPVDNLAIPKQVHGARVVRVVKAGVYADCDALVTNEKNVFLRVTVADCLPVFLFDPDALAVAAVHAGWRGCAQGVVQKTVMKMADEFSTMPASLRVFIGPSARACCYEIGEEVAAQFYERFLVRHKGNRPHLDMLGLTLNLLDGCGIPGTHVEVSPHCTIHSPQLFHSYRRDGMKSGRMMGVIGIKPP
jgi:YfiH family protein